MQSAVAVLLITLGVGQLIAVIWKLGGMSLAGRYRLIGGGVGLGLVGLGSLLLPQTAAVLLLTPIAGLIAVGLLLLGGSFIAPIPNPNALFEPDHPAHGGCNAVQIPDGPHLGPGLLVRPKGDGQKMAVCIVPGAGDTKLFFKWQLVEALLAQGITVLTIDLPGHGGYRHRPLVYPDCLTAIPAAIAFLRQQPGVEQVGLLGISLGGAMAIRAVAEAEPGFVDALAVVATPTRLDYSKRLFYQEVWRTFYGSPVVPLLQEITARQARAMWRSGGYRGQHTTAALIDLLRPLENIKRIVPTPLLLVYSQRDAIAPLPQAQALHQAAPHANLITIKKASHVMLTLTPKLNAQIAKWFVDRLR